MLIELLLGVTLLAAFTSFFLPDGVVERAALALSLLPVAVALYMYAVFDGAGNALLGGDLAFRTKVTWLSVGNFDLSYFVGLDGISMPLIVLSTVLTTLAILASWTPIDERKSQFYGLMFFMEFSLLGVFSALDFFAWFVFWEFVLVPMYFLIGIWGGPRRKYAAIKFFVYTNVASLVMFVGYGTLVFSLGDSVSSLELPAVAQAATSGGVGSVLGFAPGTVSLLAFTLMFLGFAVKVPVVPFHTWLPDAHVEAPTPVSIMLAGVLLKMGTYAMLRFNFTMLPDVARAVAPILGAVAVVSVIYGAFLALAQQDLKRIVAYSSVSSMGYVILGLAAYTPFGTSGATFQMVSHGLISGLMFMAVGVIYNVTHTRMVEDMGGLADRMPVTVGALVAGAFGYMGLPLMSGFAGEFFVFVGSFANFPNGVAFPYSPIFTALAMFGIVVVAGYLLFAMQRTLFGTYRLETDYEATRAAVHDVFPLLVLVVLIIALGSFPMPLAFDAIRDASMPVVDVGRNAAAMDLGLGHALRDLPAMLGGGVV